MKLINPVFLGKGLEWGLTDYKWRSKALCLAIIAPTKRLAAQSILYALHKGK